MTMNSVLTEVLTLLCIINIIDVVNLKTSFTCHTSGDFTAGLSDFGSSGSNHDKATILGVSTGCCVGVALGKKEAVRVFI